VPDVAKPEVEVKPAVGIGHEALQQPIKSVVTPCATAPKPAAGTVTESSVPQPPLVRSSRLPTVVYRNNLIRYRASRRPCRIQALPLLITPLLHKSPPPQPLVPSPRGVAPS
jgi:hypothetical protein